MVREFSLVKAIASVCFSPQQIVTILHAADSFYVVLGCSYFIYAVETTLG